VPSRKPTIANNIRVARDGEEAINLLFTPEDGAPAFLPQVILLDFKLPKVDGPEVLRRILRTAAGRDPRTGAEGVFVTVADTGFGMDAATRSRIFEPFFSTKGITGTGLGLWVSQTILEKHGGRVGVRSRVRHHPSDRGGTVFRIFLPLQ
jgi:signal transduction histidine kinase